MPVEEEPQGAWLERAADSVLVRVTQSAALLLAFAGVVAGFWHIMWIAGVGILVSGAAVFVGAREAVISSAARKDSSPWRSFRPRGLYMPKFAVCGVSA